MDSSTRALLAAVGSVCLLTCYPAHGDQPSQTAQVPTAIWMRDVLFGSWNGLKPALGDDGITIGVIEQAVAANVLAGGARQGDAFTGLLTPSARIDLDRYTGIPVLPPMFPPGLCRATARPPTMCTV